MGDIARMQRTQVELNLMRGRQVKLNTVQRTQVETISALGRHALCCTTVQRTQVETITALGRSQLGPVRAQCGDIAFVRTCACTARARTLNARHCMHACMHACSGMRAACPETVITQNMLLIMAALGLRFCLTYGGAP